MKPKHQALAASLLAGALLLNGYAANAQNNPPAATATRPAQNPPGQTSLPNNAPAATIDRTTGQVNQDPTVKQMNDAERGKVDKEGK
jgi:hypothetical protein